MNITFITTLDHNVGDDFVRDGIKYLLECTLENKKINYNYIHKHIPVTVRKGFEKVRSLKLSERIEKYIPKFVTPDKIKNSDILIQSGAPLYWFHSEKNASFKNEWYKPLIEERFKKLKNKKILLNIGVGACQKYHSDGNEFFTSQKFIDFVKSFHSTCDLTIVRDELSYLLLNQLNLNGLKLPCPSIFSSDFHKVSPQKGEYVVLNYMPIGGHYDFGSNVDKKKWESSFSTFYKNLIKEERVILVCHDEKEHLVAKSLFPDGEIFYSRNHSDYIKLYSSAKFGIVNRVHAGFQLASNLKPSFIIGSDSRAKMASEIGLESIFINDIDIDLLKTKYNILKKYSEGKQFSRQTKELKSRVKAKYLEHLRQVILK